MKKKIIIAAIIVALIGLASSIVLMRQPKPPIAENPNTNNQIPKPTPIVQAGTKPELTIASPQPAGAQVTVATVAIPVHGFVVIREAINGQPGKIVGASNLILFPKTEQMKIAATVLKGKSYIAELYQDNGNGLFDSKTDQPLLTDGKTTTAAFKAK
jgi:hypothetical protein